MRISDWSSDVCSSDLEGEAAHRADRAGADRGAVVVRSLVIGHVREAEADGDGIVWRRAGQGGLGILRGGGLRGEDGDRTDGRPEKQMADQATAPCTRTSCSNAAAGHWPHAAIVPTTDTAPSSQTK